MAANGAEAPALPSLGARVLSPPSPSADQASPNDIFSLLEDAPPSADLLKLQAQYAALHAQHVFLQAEHAALQARHAALQENHDERNANLSLVTSLVEPLTRLEKICAIEDKRCSCSDVAESPLLAGLRANVGRLHSALEAHGIEQIAPKAGDVFDVGLCEISSALGRAPRPASVATAPAAEQLVEDCHLHGLRHSATGTVLRRALVRVKPAAAVAAPSSAAPPPHAGGTSADAAMHADGTMAAHFAAGGGPREHILVPSDTIQGVALRYGVSPAAIARLNRLPAGGGGTALHLRTRLAIPPPPSAAPPSTAAPSEASDARPPPPPSRTVPAHAPGGGDAEHDDDGDDDWSDGEEERPLRLAQTRRRDASSCDSGPFGLFGLLNIGQRS